MIIVPKSFPKLQIFFLCILISFTACTDKPVSTVDNEKFIEIYARLLIIYELEVSKEYHDRLIDELFREYQITADQIDSTLSYLNHNPEEWVSTLDQIRKRIQALRNEFSPEEKSGPEAPEEPIPVIKKPIRPKDSDLMRNKRKRTEKLKEKSKERSLKQPD